MRRPLSMGFALFLASNAAAQDMPAASVDNTSIITGLPAPEVVVGLGFSTLGANLEAAYRINPTYQVRGVVMGGVDIDYDETDQDAEFRGNVTLGGLALLGDFYPLQSRWRVSGGVLFSNAELRGTGTVDVEGATNVDAEVGARFASDAAPMITTGYDMGIANGWSLSTEAGVIFTGGIDVIYTADDPNLQDEIDNDPDLQDVVQDASDLAIYPYASVTVSFRF